jgi:hypothetical protein
MYIYHIGIRPVTKGVDWNTMPLPISDNWLERIDFAYADVTSAIQGALDATQTRR